MDNELIKLHLERCGAKSISDLTESQLKRHLSLMFPQLSEVFKRGTTKDIEIALKIGLKAAQANKDVAVCLIMHEGVAAEGYDPHAKTDRKYYINVL